MNIQQALPNRTLTKSELLKNSVLEIARKLLTDYENDIETGIEEGLYDAADNVANLDYIATAKETLAAFEKQQHSVYVYVEGGNIQSAGATCEMDFVLYDKDNFRAGDLPQDKTPEEWNTYIEELTASNEIKSVH